MNSAVAAVLRAEIAATGMTQSELEQRSGIPIVSLQRYLAGKRPISVETLDAVAGALGMTILDVFEEVERRRGRRESATPGPSSAKPLPRSVEGTSATSGPKVGAPPARQRKIGRTGTHAHGHM